MNDKRPRTVFTRSQLNGLESSWDNGLYNTKDKDSVSTLADNLALTEQQVKDWIGNKRTKLKRTSSGARILSTPKAPMMKGPTAYNLFCKGKSLNYSSSGQTFCQWSTEWKNMKEEERQKYQEEAVSFKKNVVHTADRTKLKKHHLKLISQSCDVLSSLEMHVGGLFVDTDGCAGAFGSSRAHDYFCQKSIRQTFASQMQASESNINKETDLDHSTAVNLVRKKFNDCWEKATGNHQVPYKAFKEGKFILEVKNLPSGVKFSTRIIHVDPSCMGLKTLKSIMSVKDIEIIVLSQPSNTPVLGNEGWPTQTETAQPEQLENEAIIPSLSGRAETVQQLDNEAMIPSLSKDDVDILLDAVGSSELSESNEASVEPSASKIYEVQQILQRRKRGKRKEVLIKWKNFDTPTWEPEENLVS